MIDGSVIHTSTRPLTHRLWTPDERKEHFTTSVGLLDLELLSRLPVIPQHGLPARHVRETVTRIKHKHKHTATQQTTQALPFGWSACCSKLHLSGIRATPSLTVATSVLRASCRHGNSPDQTFPQSRDISVGTFP